jgi:nucleotide-binding universal stress UspA family protein
MTPAEAPLSLPPLETAALQDNITAELLAQLDALGGAGHHATVRTYATAVDGLCALAEEIGIDLIVIPSTGKGRIQRWLLGSTTERLTKRSHVPVLVLPGLSDAG